MNETYTIQVPVELAKILVQKRALVNVRATNRDLRLMSTWLCLKSLTTSGKIQNYGSKIEFLTKYCKVSQSLFYTQLSRLSAMGLLTRTKGKKGAIIMASWQRLAELYEIDIEEKEPLKYVLTDATKVYHIITALEIKANQQNQLDALSKRLHHNPWVEMDLCQLFIRAGADRARLDDPKYFQQCLLKVQMHTFIHGSEMYEAIHLFEAQVDRGVRKMATDHRFKSPSSISYWKKQLQQLGVLQIKKHDPLISRCKAIKRKHHRGWDEATDQPKWYLCDVIVFSPNLCTAGHQEGNKKTAAA